MIQHALRTLCTLQESPELPGLSVLWALPAENNLYHYSLVPRYRAIVIIVSRREAQQSSTLCTGSLHSQYSLHSLHSQDSPFSRRDIQNILTSTIAQYRDTSLYC